VRNINQKIFRLLHCFDKRHQKHRKNIELKEVEPCCNVVQMSDLQGAAPHGRWERWSCLQRFLWQDLSLTCLNLNMDKKVLETVRTCGSFLFFCDLVETIRSSTRKIEEMCSNTVASVRATVATVAEDNKTPAPVAELKTRAQRAKAAKVKAGPEKQEIPVTRPTEEKVLLTSPSAAEKPKSFGNFFVGTSNDASDVIPAVEERRLLVLLRIHPDTTSDKIANFIRRKTGITNIRCHLMIPRGKTVNELEYLSFKVGVEVANYIQC
jgi:hypothetical protein